MINYQFAMLFLASIVLSCREVNSNTSRMNDSPLPLTSAFTFGKDGKRPCVDARVFINPSQSSLLVSYLNGEVSGWDISRGRQIFHWDTRRLGLRDVGDGYLLRDGTQILLAGSQGIAQLNLLDGKEIASYDGFIGVRDSSYYSVVARDDGVFGAATALTTWPHYIPDPTGLGVSSQALEYALKIQPQKLILFDLKNKRELSSLEFKDSFVRSIQFSQNRKYLVTTSYLSIRFWNIVDPLHIRLESEINLKDLEPNSARSNIFVSVAVSLDLKLIAVATLNGVYVASTESRLIIPSMRWYQPRGIPMIRHIQWSFDSLNIMGADLQGRVYVWSPNPDSLSYSGYYGLGTAHDGSVVDMTSSSATPYPAFAIDPFRRYFVRPGAVDVESFGTCAGFDVMRLPDFVSP